MSLGLRKRLNRCFRASCPVNGGRGDDAAFRSRRSGDSLDGCARFEFLPITSTFKATRRTPHCARDKRSEEILPGIPNSDSRLRISVGTGVAVVQDWLGGPCTASRHSRRSTGAGLRGLAWLCRPSGTVGSGHREPAPDDFRLGRAAVQTAGAPVLTHRALRTPR